MMEFTIKEIILLINLMTHLKQFHQERHYLF